MLTVLLQSLVLAAGGIVSVGSITIVILLLISDQGWRNGLGYALGYVGAYTLIGISAVMLNYNYTSTTPDPVEASSNMTTTILLIVMGILLLFLSVRNWRKKPSEAQQPPRLFAIVDNITPLRAFLLGAVISVVNIKNFAIFMSAVSVLLLSNLMVSTQLMIVLLVVIVFCGSVIIPVGIYLIFPNNAYTRLNAIKQTLETYSRPIGIWIPLIFGSIFVLQGVRTLL